MNEIYNYFDNINNKKRYVEKIFTFSAIITTILLLLIFVLVKLQWWIIPFTLFAMLVMWYMILYMYPIQFIIYDDKTLLLPINIFLYKRGIHKIVKFTDIELVKVGNGYFFFKLKKGNRNYIDFLPGANIIQLNKLIFKDKKAIIKEKKLIKKYIKDLKMEKMGSN